MFLNQAVKQWLIANGYAAAGASDDDFRKGLSKALGESKLTGAKYAELSATADPAAGGAAAGAAIITAAVAEGVKQALAGFNLGQKAPETPPPTPTPPPEKAPVQEPITQAQINKMIADGISQGVKAAIAGGQSAVVNPQMVLTRGLDDSGNVPETHRVRVKSALERFDGTKRQLILANKQAMGELAGTPAVHMDRPVMLPSQLDKALIGSWLKFSIGAAFNRPYFGMTDTDKDLLEYALRECEWTGYVGGWPEPGDSIKGEAISGRLTPSQQKALLNDVTSGGTNAVPVIYDDAAIMAPLQTGELFPWVTVTPIPRGRVFRSLSVGTPVISSGIPEGTAIPLFDTTGFIAALDTTIYPCVGAVEIGLDFEEDSPANFGQILIDRYGEVHLKWLDDQIALGDGTTEPLGLFGTATMTLVPAAAAGTGPWSLADLEALIFGVAREYRRARGGRMVFVMNDNTYRRFRQIATATGWNTRLFGDDYQSYTMLGYPVRIIADVPNNKICFVNLAYYRMFRRQGLQVKVTTEGRELSLKNLRLIVVRALWGGRLEQGGAGSLLVDGML